MTDVTRAGVVLSAVVLIEASDADIVERMAGRVTCQQGHVFHVRTAPPARPEHLRPRRRAAAATRRRPPGDRPPAP